MTCIYGTTEEGHKRTGRDERVRPTLVLYDASLSQQLPLRLTVQSLSNALAQIVSALSTGSVSLADVRDGVAELWRVMGALERQPTDVRLREQALRAASVAGAVVDRGTMGAQHRLAHALGSRFDLDHATVHSVLLPALMQWLRGEQPQLMQGLDRAAGVERLEVALRDRLRAVGAPTSLAELRVSPPELDALLDSEPELPAAILEIARGDRSS
jgi:maleylacetate reductase